MREPESNLPALDPNISAFLARGGDASKLTQVQRDAYYLYMCAMFRMDPATVPFKWLDLKGRLVLYADKGFTQQLCAQRKISTQIIEQSTEDDMRIVVVRATDAEGRFSDELGAVPLTNFKGTRLVGEEIANATMKAVTKAKRRAVLALVGLNMLDDSEIESIRDAKRRPDLLPKVAQEALSEAASSPDDVAAGDNRPAPVAAASTAQPNPPPLRDPATPEPGESYPAWKTRMLPTGFENYPCPIAFGGQKTYAVVVRVARDFTRTRTRATIKAKGLPEEAFAQGKPWDEAEFRLLAAAKLAEDEANGQRQEDGPPA